MNKQTMTKEMELKINEVQEARNTVFTFVDEIEDAVQAGEQTVSAMETELSGQRNSLTMAQDLGEAKLIKNQIDRIQEDLELQKAVNVGKKKAMYEQLANKAEEFLKVHKSAVFLFKSVDDFYLVNTSLSELTVAKEMLQGFASQLSVSFAGVRNILLDTGIVAMADQNRMYRGIYLGQIVRETQLSEFKSRVQPFLNDLSRAGVVINK